MKSRNKDTRASGSRKGLVPLRRRRRSSGHVLMESTLTMIPMFALILGFVNFGLTIFRWSTLQNAVREGCRYAITYQTTSGLGQDQSIKNVVQSYALGMVDASLTGSAQQVFVKYYTQGTAIDPPGTPAGSSHAVAAPGGNISGNIVVVSIEGYNNGVNWVSPILTGTPSYTLNVLSADVMGSLPFGFSSVTR